MPTISSNAYYDVACPSGGYITVENGATLTIRKTNYASQAAADITIADGRVLFDPSVTGGVSPIRFLMSGRMVLSKAAKFEANGSWHYLGTSDGTANQAFAFFSPSATDTCPYCQVETGNGTDVWVDFLNIGINSTALTGVHPTSLEKGCFFKKNGGTLLFGDGTNGVIPPNGARIRVPNIHIQYGNGASEDTGGNNIQWDIGSGATLDIEKLSTSYSFWFNMVAPSSVKIKDCGLGGGRFYLYNPGYIDVDGLSIPFPNARNTYPACHFTGIAGNYTINRIKSSPISDASGIKFTNITDEATISNVTVPSLVANTVNLSTALYIENCSNINLNGIKIAASPMNIAGSRNLNVNNYRFTSHLTTQSTHATMSLIGIAPSSKYNDIALWESDGTPPLGSLFTANNNSSVTNVNIEMNGVGNTNWPLVTIGSATGFMLARASFGNIGSRTYIFNIPTNSFYSKGCKYYNVKTSTALTKLFSDDIIGFKGTEIKNVTAPTLPSAGASAPAGAGIPGSSDQAFFVINNTDNTTGKICVIAATQIDSSYYEVLAGTPYFGNDNKVMLKKNGDSVQFTCPFPIYGVSSIINTTPVYPEYMWGGVDFSASDRTKLSFKQEGGDWTPYYGINTQMATIAGLTFDPALGLYVRVKITSNSNNDTAYFRHIFIGANINGAALYPVAFTSIKLDNIVLGSTYRISRNSDDSVVASGTATGTTVNITGIPYASDEAITIRVRKPGYKPFETGGTIVSTASSVWVSQESDAAVYLPE